MATEARLVFAKELKPTAPPLLAGLSLCGERERPKDTPQTDRPQTANPGELSEDCLSE